MDETSPLARAPRLSPLTLGLGIVVALGGVLLLEGVGAQRGIEPAAADGARSWTLAYRAALAHPDSVVLVGSSRAALGLDPAVMAETLGRPSHNLTINGGNPLPVLERLASDGYRGTVIAEFMGRRLLAEDTAATATSARYVSELDNPSVLAGPEQDATRWVANRLRTRSAPMQLLSLFRAVVARTMPGVPARTTRPDRFQATDVDRVPREALEARWTRRAERSVPYEGDARDAAFTLLARLDRTFRQAGGRLVWVRLPTSGTVRDAEDTRFPRASVFDRVSRPADRWHYADDASTRSLTCFDGSHLAPDDAARLTAAVGRWLSARSRP